MNSTPSEFLLQQFDAIEEFVRKVQQHRSNFRAPRQVKQMYFVGFLREDEEPDLYQMCQDLEKTVPIDHPFWSTW